MNTSIIYNQIKEDYPILVISWIRELSKIIAKIKDVSLKTAMKYSLDKHIYDIVVFKLL